jgi:hypothetical protein
MHTAYMKTTEPRSTASQNSGIGLDSSLEVPANASKLPGFRAWAHSSRFPDHARICFLDGELFIAMSPEELENHNKVKEVIGRAIGNLNEQCDSGEFFTDAVLVTNVNANLATEPDATFIRLEVSRGGHGKIYPAKESTRRIRRNPGQPRLVTGGRQRVLGAKGDQGFAESLSPGQDPGSLAGGCSRRRDFFPNSRLSGQQIQTCRAEPRLVFLTRFSAFFSTNAKAQSHGPVAVQLRNQDVVS